MSRTPPVVWLFFTGTAFSLFILRRREPGVVRPYRVFGYPIVPLIFCAYSLFMLHSSLAYAWNMKPAALALMSGILLLGVPVFWAGRWYAARS